MTGFIYKWTNTIDGKWYIGSHKGTTNDGYIGSGVYFLRAVKKYGIENFTRKILYEGDYEKDQIKSVVEANFLREEDAANNPMSYNMSNMTGSDAFSKETIQKLSGENNSNYKNRARQGKIQPFTGKTHTKETRTRMSEKAKGRKHSEETKQKIAEARRGTTIGLAQREKISKTLQGQLDQIVICPNCQKQGGNSAMKRWHFDNCTQN